MRHASLVSMVFVLFLGAASSAYASPMLATFEGQFNAGPLAGSAFTVNYWFNALKVRTGLLRAAGRVFGPFWTLPVPSLPVGLLEWGFTGDPSYYYQYSNSACSTGTCTVIDSFTNITVTPVRPSSIPEPSTLLIAVGSLASLALGARVRTRRGVAR